MTTSVLWKINQVPPEANNVQYVNIIASWAELDGQSVANGHKDRNGAAKLTECCQIWQQRLTTTKAFYDPWHTRHGSHHWEASATRTCVSSPSILRPRRSLGCTNQRFSRHPSPLCLVLSWFQNVSNGQLGPFFAVDAALSGDVNLPLYLLLFTLPNWLLGTWRAIAGLPTIVIAYNLYRFHSLCHQFRIRWIHRYNIKSLTTTTQLNVTILRCRSQITASLVAIFKSCSRPSCEHAEL